MELRIFLGLNGQVVIISNLKFEINITTELWNNYCDKLVNKFFAILPIFEGKDFYTKKTILNSQLAFTNFQKRIDNFIYEINGGAYLFDNDANFLELLNNLAGLKLVEINEHNKVKSIVFNCIDIVNKMKRS